MDEIDVKVYLSLRNSEAALLQNLLQDQLLKLTFMQAEPCTPERAPFVERLLQTDWDARFVMKHLKHVPGAQDQLRRGVLMVVYVQDTSPLHTLAKQYVANQKILKTVSDICTDLLGDGFDIEQVTPVLREARKQTERLLAPAQFQRRLKSALRTDPVAIRQFFAPGRRKAEKRGRQQGRQVARALLKEPGGFARVFRPGGQMARLAAEEFRTKATAPSLKQTRRRRRNVRPKATKVVAHKNSSKRQRRKKTAMRPKKTKARRLRM